MSKLETVLLLITLNKGRLDKKAILYNINKSTVTPLENFVEIKFDEKFDIVLDAY